MNYKKTICVALFLLTGCEQLSLSPEAKINKAYPINQQLLLAKTEALAQPDETRRTVISNEFESRMKVRALNCAKGYVPSWYTSTEEIRKNISDQNCFTNSDNETAAWLGLIRIGILLDKPALVPVPQDVPKYIVAAGKIQSANFADQAGVAALEVSQNIQVVDISSGKQFFQAAITNRDSQGAVSLSNNGQILAASSDGKLVFYGVESGAVIAEIPAVKATRFYWLANNSGVFSGTNNKIIFIDFLSGKTSPIAGVQGWINRIIPVNNQYFLLSSRRNLSKIQIKRLPGGAEAFLVDEKPLDNLNWSQAATGLLADGSKFFYLNQDLFLVSLNDMSQQKIAFAPIDLASVTATPDPDKVVVFGSSRGLTQNIYEYSIKQQALSPVDESQLASQWFIFIPALKKIGVFSESKIVLMDKLPVGEPVQLSSFVSQVAEAASLKKIEEYERRSAMGAPSVGYYPSASEAPAAEMGYSQLGAIAKDARIEGVGVYQGLAPPHRSGSNRVMGVVRVAIRKSDKPIILSLSSYEPVRWFLTPESGAKVSAIILSGYHQSQVVNAGSARVINLGSNFAYDRSSSNYSKLDSDIYRMTGKHFSLFQGRYEGSEFSVGGF